MIMLTTAAASAQRMYASTLNEAAAHWLNYFDDERLEQPSQVQEMARGLSIWIAAPSRKCTKAQLNVFCTCRVMMCEAMFRADESPAVSVSVLSTVHFQ